MNDGRAPQPGQKNTTQSRDVNTVVSTVLEEESVHPWIDETILNLKTIRK